MNTHNASQHPVTVTQPIAGMKVDLGTIWVAPWVISALETAISSESMKCGPHQLLTDMLCRHASGNHGELDDEEAREVEGKVRSWYGGVFGSEIEIETDLNEGVTRVLPG
jgi:hypothetical protein